MKRVFCKCQNIGALRREANQSILKSTLEQGEVMWSQVMLINTNQKIPYHHSNQISNKFRTNPQIKYLNRIKKSKIKTN